MTITSALDQWFSDEKWVRAGFTAALGMLVAIAAFAYHSLVVMDRTSDLVGRSYEVQTSIAEIDALYARARLRWRAYMTNGNPDVLANYRAAATELPARMDTLQILMTDNKDQQSRLSAARDLISGDMAAMDQVIALKNTGQFKSEAEIFAALSRPRPAIARANAALLRMTDEEARRLAIREREDKQEALTARVVLITGTTTSIAILLLAFFLLSRRMQQLKNAEQGIMALNAQLQRRTEHLERANKELESFSYSVSHDLRAPLRAIGGYALMLDEDAGARLGEGGKRHLAIIRGEADRMGLLIDDLLAFLRLGRKELRIASFDMAALMHDVIEEVRPSATANTRIDVQPLPDVAADRALLRQVWMNLVGNAIKYAGNREAPLVRISGRVDDGMAIYRIEDNGAGFDMRHYNKLFGVFQRLHSNEDFPGTGIGLAIVQRVVGRHRGKVWAEGEPDRGAVFYFSLPVEAGTSAER